MKQQWLAWLVIGVLLSACGVSDLLSDDDEDQTELPTDDNTADPEAPTSVPMTLDNYRTFLSVALTARPRITVEGLRVGRFPTYSAIDFSRLDEAGTTTTITHACSASPGSAITTQYKQLPAEGEPEPQFGIAGDFTRTEFVTCLRDDFIYDGSYGITLTSHNENAFPTNITDFVVFLVSNSISTYTLTEHSVTDTVTDRSVTLNGVYTETKRRVSEQNFINSAERTEKTYLDKITATNLSIVVDESSGSGINETYTTFNLTEDEDAIQWSGSLEKVIDGETYALTIENISELKKSLNDNFYSSGQMTVSDGTSLMTINFIEGAQADVQLDLDMDSEVDLQTTVSLTNL